MPKQLNFITDKGPVSIELLDTDFAEFWLEHFLTVQQHYNLEPNAVTWPCGTKSVDPNLTVAHINKLIETVDKINQLEYLQPIPEPVTVELLAKLDLSTQQLLNRLHRYLVVATEFRNRWIVDSAPIFVVPADDEEYMYLLNLANQTIHALEEHVRIPNRHRFHAALRFCEVSVAGSKYKDVNVYTDDVDKPIPDSMFPYLRFSGYDVWIKKDILGKDYITAFADHDDLTAFDVRPPPMISGGFIVDFDKTARQRLFNNKEFVEWVGAPTDYHGSYPLGNVVKGKENFINCKEITFINVDNIS